MTDPRSSEDDDAFEMLSKAVTAFARDEITRLAGATIADLRGREPVGIFDADVAARHMWDEYCWGLQEGGYDDDIEFSGVNLGSIAGGWRAMARSIAGGEIEKLPRNLRTLLSAGALDMDPGRYAEDWRGGIYLDAIIDAVLEEVDAHASHVRLDLIGPDRTDVVPYEIVASGCVWGALSELGSGHDLIAEHVDTLIDPKADLTKVAEQAVDAFISAAQDADGQSEGIVLSHLIEHFEHQIRGLLLEYDALPALEDMRGQIDQMLDKST